MHIFATFLCFSSLSVCNVFGSYPKDFEKFSYLTSALKYNDECSWENELLRIKFTYKLSNSPSSITSPSNIDETLEFKNDVVANKRKLCNVLEHFICEQETERCVCGEAAKRVFFPTFNVSSDFVVVKDEKGIDRCQWNEGSYCINDDMVNDVIDDKKIEARSYQKCVKGTTCTSSFLAENNQDCSMDILMMYALKNRATVTKESLMTAMFDGSICSCQSDVASNVVSKDYFGKSSYERKYRFKRSLGESIGAEDREWARAMIAPALKYF